MDYYFQEIDTYWPFVSYDEDWRVIQLAGYWWKQIENYFIRYWPGDVKNALFYPPALVDTPRDNLAPAQFVAGWLDSSQRDSDTLASCIKKSDDLTNALYDAMEIILKGEKKLLDKSKVKARKNALDKMKEFWTLLSPAMADCGQIAEQIQDKEKRF